MLAFSVISLALFSSLASAVPVHSTDSLVTRYTGSGGASSSGGGSVSVLGDLVGASGSGRAGASGYEHARGLNLKNLLNGDLAAKLQADGFLAGSADASISASVNVDITADVATELVGSGLSRGNDHNLHYKCPTEGWTVPKAYEFGYFHPTTGAWINDETSVNAYLHGLGYGSLDVVGSANLFASVDLTLNAVATGSISARAADWTRKGQCGYWAPSASASLGTDAQTAASLHAGVFVNADAQVTPLLNGCGYFHLSAQAQAAIEATAK